MIVLKKKSSYPLYKQIYNDIKSDINSKKSNTGDRIDSELELSEKYNVSRITVRKAIEILVDEGLLFRKQGKGTFVKEKKIERKLEHLISFSESCLSNNMIPSSIVLKKEIVDSNSLEQEFFSLGCTDSVIKIERLRLADGRPIIIERITFPKNDIFLCLLEEDLSGSLFSLLNNKYMIRPFHTRKSILEITFASGEIRKWLNVPDGTPVFFLRSSIFDDKYHPIYLVELHIVAEMYKFNFD